MLIGRAAERARISALISDAGDGRSGAILIVGDPGVGKTTLLDDAVESATGVRVLRASGFEMEADLAFAALAALLRPLGDGIAALPPPQAAALGGALGLGPPLPPGDRFTAYAGALTLLSEAAEGSPLLVAVDDAHWLDPASLDALAFVARRIAAEGIVIVMAAREEPPAALEHADGVELMRVEGLVDEDARALVRREAPASVEDAVAAALASVTEGNPLALIEATALLDPDQMAGRAPLPDPLPVGPGVSRALAARLDPLPADTRRALLVVAAGAGDAGLVAEVLASSGLDGALGPAEEAGLVEVTAPAIVFRHPLVRASVYSTAPAADRERTHRLLAEAARARGDAGLEAFARHLAAAVHGPDEEAAAALEVAGRRAAARMGYAEAAESLRSAARLTDDPAARAPRLVEAGSLAMMSGRGELARESLETAIREAEDPMVAAAARGARAHLEMMTGSVRVARELLVGEAERMGPDAGPAGTLMLVDAALASAMGADAPRGRELSSLAELRLRDDDPVSVSSVVWVLRAYFAVITAEADAGERIDRMTDPMNALADGDPLGWTRILVSIQLLNGAGRYEAAAALAERLIGTGRALSAPSMLPFPLAARAELRLATGDWDGALASASEALELAEQTGQRGVAAFSRCCLARLFAARGEEVACRAQVAAAIGSVPRHEAGSLATFASAAEGLLDLGLGRLDGALALLERTYESCMRGGFRSHLLIPYLTDLIEVAVRLDRAELAADRLAYLETLARPGFPGILGAVARGRGLVAEDSAEAIAHLSTAVAREEEAGTPFERARSQLLLGERMRSARRRREAQAHLAAAFATFESLGAAPWAERAATTLGALGARPRARDSSAARDLTAQELQVARGAAEGLSNKEIAAQLFLSVKTVEFHLRNAFVKLGVRSRTELAGRMTVGPRSESGGAIP